MRNLEYEKGRNVAILGQLGRIFALIKVFSVCNNLLQLVFLCLSNSNGKYTV